MNVDIFEEVCKYLCPDDMIRFSSTCERFKSYTENEAFWVRYCKTYWGHQFWERASRRPIRTCKPHISMYHEFSRLASYEKLFHTEFHRTITMSDYESMWKSIDKK